LIEVNFFPDPHDLTISISESCELAGHQISELTDAALSHVCHSFSAISILAISADFDLIGFRFVDLYRSCEVNS